MLKITEPAVVDLHLLSAPDSVALVRAGLKGFAALLRLEPELLEDLQLVTSEACNNVILHAYRDGPGPLDVHIMAWRDGVDVVVRDHGCGLGPETPHGDPNGLGLVVIESLADDAEIVGVPGGGTEIRMRFHHAVPSLAAPAAAHEDTALSPDGILALPGAIVASVSPVELLEGVLGRLARTLAAQARFSIDRFPELHALVGTLAAHAGRHARTRGLTCSLEAETRRLELLVAPVDHEAGEVPRPRGHLEVEPRLDAETLCLTLRERGFASAA